MHLPNDLVCALYIIWNLLQLKEQARQRSARWKSKSKYEALDRDQLSNYMARANVARWMIAKWGRWASDCWEYVYARLDSTDLAKLTDTTLIKWFASNATKETQPPALRTQITRSFVHSWGMKTPRDPI